jgi:uncharacterized delta-60 repeat protein
MFSPFAFIQPENLGVILASTSSLFVVGDFFTYKATNLGNVAILTNSGSRTFLSSRLSSFNQGGDTPSAVYPGAGGSLNEQDVIQVSDCHFESNGKLMIVGGFQNYSGSSANHARRINPDGTRDLSWTVGSFTSRVYTCTQQRDGKYIFTGLFSSYSGSAVNYIVRTNISGTLDTTFKTAAVDNWTYTVTEDASNRLIIGGAWSQWSGSTAGRIVRVNTSGSIDTTFNTGAGFDGSVRGVVLQSDGKIIVTGDFTTYSGSAVNRIVRLNTDGTRDTTYKVGQTLNQFSQAQTPVGIGIQSDNKVIAYGDFTTYSGSARNRITRINTDGTLDTTFNPGAGFDRIDNDSSAINTKAQRKIQIESNTGKIYVAGGFTSYSGSQVNALIKLNPDGTIDTTFDYTGSVVSGFGYSRFNITTNSPRTAGVAAIALTGSSVAAVGRFNTYKEPHIGGIVRLDSSGSMYQNTTLNVSGGFQYAAYSAAWYVAQVNAIRKVGDKFLIAGGFTQYNSTSSVNRIIMLNSNFTIDTTFKSGTGFNSSINQLLYNESTGKILVGGNFTTYSGSSVNRIAQLNTNGTLDISFASGLSGFNGEVSNFATEPNGKIVVGGSFTTYNGITQNRIIRLNSNGGVDADFKTGTGVTTGGASVYAVAVQSDGKIVFGGWPVNAYSGSTTNTRIFRTLSSGSIDPGFNFGTGLNSGLTQVKQDSNGKLIILTEASTYNGATINRIARLNTDGTRDTTFNTGTGFNIYGLGNYSNSIEFDSTGNIYVAGDFDFYSGSRSHGLVKIKTDGSIDTTFTTSGSNGTGFSQRVRGLLLDTSTI